MKTLILLVILCPFSSILHGQITSHPANSSACLGSSTTFTVAAAGSGLTYQWQVNTGSSWSDITTSGSNPTYSGYNSSATLNVNSVVIGNNNYKYRCIVSSDTSNSATLTVNTPSTAPTSITASQNPICNGQSTTLSMSGGSLGSLASWRWYITSCGSGFITSGSSITVSPTSTTSYYLRAEGTCNNTACANISITINNPPTISSHPTNSTICAGNNSSFSVNATGAGLTYQWQVNTGSVFNNISTAGSSPTYSNYNTNSLTLVSVVPGNNNYQYRCIVTGTCTPSATSNAATLTVNTAPSITSHPINSTICVGNSTSFSVNATGTGLSYQWQVNTGSGFNNISTSGSNPTYLGFNTSSTLNVNSVIASNNNYKYQCIISGTCSPSVTSNAATMIVNTSPSITSHPSSSTICEGNSTSFSITATGSGLNYQWQVNTGSGFSDITTMGSTPQYVNFNSSTLNVNYVISWNNNYQYRCVVTGTCSPSVTSNPATLLVNTMPTISSHPVNSIVCENIKTAFQITAYGTNINYQWQVNNGSGWNDIFSQGTSPIYANWTSSSLQVSNMKFIHNGYQYRCLVSNTACQTAISNPAKLIVNPSPTVNAGKDTSVCSGSFILLSTNSSGSTPPYSYVWSPTIGLNNPYVSNPQANPLAITVYTLTVTDANGCINIDDIKIDVNPLPFADAGSDTSFCEGNNATLMANGGIFYKWSPSIGLNDTTIVNPIANPKKTTNYKLTVTDANNCSSEDKVKIIVFSLPDADAGTDTSICSGQTTHLTANGGIYYSWFPSIGLNNTNILNPVSTPSKTITYRVTVGNLNGCTNIDSVKITVNPLPTIIAGPKSAAICFGDSIILSGSGAVNYSWTPSISLKNPTTPDPSAKPTATTLYILTGADNNHCSNSDTIMVIVNALPVADIGIDLLICVGDTAQLNAKGGFAYSWFPKTNLNNSLIPNPLVYPSKTTEYILTLTDSNNCVDTDSITITPVANPKPEINGDSAVCKNEKWASYHVNSTSNNIIWSIVEGTILNGQGANSIKVHWANNDLNKSVLVTEKLKNSPFCFSRDTFIVNSTNGTAPNSAIVIAKSNDISTHILLTQFSSFNIYKWGYESKLDNKEIYTCNDNTWCLFNAIDTLKYFYWVYIGNDSACLTKSYFNSPPILTKIDDMEIYGDISVYPNPTSGKFTLKSMAGNIESVLFYNLLGERVPELSERKQDTWDFDLSNLNDGIYFIQVNEINRSRMIKIIKY